MSEPKLPESDRDLQSKAISPNAIDWLEQFLKHFQINFIDRSSALPGDADINAFQRTTIRVLFDTLKDSDSRTDNESLLELIGQVLSERSPSSEEWSGEKHARRFALIDKDIQKGLTIKEQIELATLTNLMRQHIDTESNLPMAGAKALHKKLLKMDASD